MPDPWGRFTNTDELAAVFQYFAARRCAGYAPLYARLGTGIATDAALLGLAASVAPGQSPPDLILAAAHYLLAREPGHPLARFYPTLSPEAPTGDPFPLFRSFCLDRRDQVTHLVSSRQVQTNEVRRSAYLLPAVMLAASMAGRPLALIEPGASAGLNLALDEYAYDYGTGTVVGRPSSPLTLQCSLRGPHQPPLDLAMPPIGWPASTSIRSTRQIRRTPPGCGRWCGPTTQHVPPCFSTP